MGLLLAAERRLFTGPISFAPLRLSTCSETETLDDGFITVKQEKRRYQQGKSRDRGQQELLPKVS